MSNNVFADGIFSQGFGFSPKLLMKDKNLTIEAKAIYAYLASYAGAGMSAFPSVDLICHDLSVTRQRYTKHRDLLVKHGYIRVEQQRNSTGFGKNLFVLVNNIEKYQNQTLQNQTLQNQPSGIVTTENSTHNSNSLKSNNLKSNNANKSMSGKPDNATESAKKIIDYLNEKAGRRYPHTKTNLDFVLGRLKEGITAKQLYSVVDEKCKQWLGTNSEQYLRPATLFNATKCNQYVGQLGMKTPNQNNGNNGIDNNDPWADAYF